MIATLTAFGRNTDVIWAFAAGILAPMLVTVIILSGVSLIKRLLDL